MAKKSQEDKEMSKKCAFTGTALKRARRYYRNGKYYLNKNAFKGAEAKQKEEAEAASK